MRVIGNGRIRRTGAGISYGSGATIKQLQDWELATNDDAAAVETTGYFNSLATSMKVGELIHARLDLDGTPQLRTYMVTANDGSVVTIARGLTGTVTLTNTANLTENSTTIGGTKDGNFATLATAWNGSTYPTAAEGNLLIDAIREIADKVNKTRADVAALKSAVGA